VLFELVEELCEELGLYTVALFALIFCKGFNHSYALVFIENAHLAHFVNLLKKQNWSVAKAHEAGNNNANIMSQVCFKLCEDVLFNLCKFRLIRLEAVNYEALVAF